ncbi:hypothetical protein L6164_026975 [Bauhinia variegata]|uniref:Uncharacterized protein n=1 Tax=Bauhinia variegata TaxID=167791 RepID=A0ACB9LSD5_BAUVA|nr:hypothetical protein L6164_026975 [Bauhinia variegata]
MPTSSLRFSVLRIFNSAYQSICTTLKPSVSQPEQRTITRIRCISAYQNQELNHLLPLYVSAIEMETSSFPPKNPLNLAKIVTSMTFQAALGMFQTMYSSGQFQDEPPNLGVVMVIGFAASFSGMFLRHSYPRLANIIDKIGNLAFAICFFLMAKAFLSRSFMWVGWLAWALSMLAFIISRLT